MLWIGYEMTAHYNNYHFVFFFTFFTLAANFKLELFSYIHKHNICHMSSFKFQNPLFHANIVFNISVLNKGCNKLTLWLWLADKSAHTTFLIDTDGRQISPFD